MDILDPVVTLELQADGTLVVDGSFLAFERDVQSRGLPAIAGEMPDGRVSSGSSLDGV